jgi:hypothetical protein
MASTLTKNPPNPLRRIDPELIPYFDKLNALYKAKQAHNALISIVNASSFDEAIASLEQ